MSAKSSIQVCIKVRPCEPELPTLWQVKDKRAIQPLDSQADPCVFDYVYDQSSNNQEVFDGMAKHIVEACVKGFNGTIFAYGQTSSGKTYTMMGDQENPGVMVLAAKEIFNQITNHSDRDFLLRVGYIEIYNEKIYDLLNKKNPDLKIYESNGMVNVNCEECIITSEDDLLQFLCVGNKERTVGETNMNERSSRSHAIFRIIIESRKADRSDDDAVIQSILNLVDLAGSERADQTGARGARLKEGSHINKSLHFLSNVIKSLAENEDNRFVNYRDSKLTRILQASLGGNAFTSIICTIRPSIMEESQSTLNFAMRAKKIRLKPQLNEIVSDATMMKRLEREIKLLKDRLAEEQARNESQLKVRLLEQRIKTDTLKIITSNTITDCRNKNRRRTWCPASSNAEVTSTGAQEVPVANGSNKPTININHSNLPKPSFYPTSGRPAQRALTGAKTINIMKSMETKDEVIPVVEPNFEKADSQLTVSQSRMRTITLTPTMAQLGAKGRELLERELVELEAFTKIEQQINAEWEELNEKLNTATAHIDELQTEKLNLLQRSEALQAEVDELRKSKEEADTKIADYEEQLKTLKATIERLDMENRAAVELEFQFSSHKSKSKQRENELISALSEKDSDIENLQKSLNDLSNEVLRNSKDDHMRSICPTLETSCELICRKCVDLERLLEEYNKKPSDNTGAQAIDCECEQLRADIASTRAQLESVQNAYKQMSSDVAEKSELCDRLSRDVISVEEAKCALQGKCDDLEQAQQRHEQIIKTMQAEYDAIQQKYNVLQQDYEKLRRAAAATEEQYKKLQSENECLQKEISTLKQSVEEMQVKLLKTVVSESHETFVKQLQSSNEQLMSNLADMEAKYGELQGEYDDLSNQLVESVQDCDGLREQLKSLQEALQKAPMEAEQLRAHIEQLEKEVDEKNQLLVATETTINEMREQMTNLQSELLEKSVIVNKVEDYQRQIESLEKQHAEMTMVCEELQEKVKETTINESLSKTSSTVIGPDIDAEQVEEVDILKDRIAKLNVELDELRTDIKKQLAVVQQKDELINEMQLEMQELNERCLSMDVQQVEMRSNAQQQQQLLDIQATKLADDANRIDQLQESNAKLTERSIKAEEALEERLKLATDIASSKAEYEKRLQQLQMELDNTREEFAKRVKLNKDELDNVNLEFLQKIEVSESRYRENLHKYNSEWEDRLQKLGTDAEAQLLAAKTESAAEREQFINEKHELESLYDECKNQVVELQGKLTLLEQECVKVKADADLETLSNDKLQELHEEYEKKLHEQQLNLDSLQDEKKSLQSAVDDNKQTIDRLNQELQAERDLRQNETSQLSRELEDAIATNTKAKAEYTEQFETFTEKVSDLQKELQEATLMSNGIDKLTLEQQQIKEALAKTTEHNKLLEQKIVDLERELLLAQAEVTTHKENLESLQSKLDCAQEAKNNLSSVEVVYTQKLNELEKEMADQAVHYKRKIDDLLSSGAELHIKVESLVKRTLELETSNDELENKLRDELGSHEMLEKERERCATLQETNVQLESVLKAKKTAWDALQLSLQQTETQLQVKQTECDIWQHRLEQSNSQLVTVKQSLQQTESRLELKQADYDSLQQSLHEAASQRAAKQAEFDELQLSLKQLQRQLEAKQAVQESLQKAEVKLKAKQSECTTLKASLNRLASEIDTKQSAINSLRLSLKQLEAKEVREDSLQRAEMKFNAMQTECFSLQDALQHAIANMQKVELQRKAKHAECETMQETLKHAIYNLQQVESQRKARQAECEALKESLEDVTSELDTKKAAIDALKKSVEQSDLQLKTTKTECDSLRESQQAMKTQLEANTIEMNNKNGEFTLRVKTLQAEIEKLRSILKSNKVNFDTERERLDATISSLLEDKRNLEEKLCTTNEIVQKLEVELRQKINSSNISIESATPSTSPGPRRSLDREQQPRKSLMIESEVRRNRRISTHDERRQSYWNDSRHVACMTDPVDTNCNCTELDRKLKECQFELFIRESKVTALSIELKNHPLKDENAQLKKRLQDEQQKARDEIKRLKSKNSDLMCKVNANVASAAISSKGQSATLPQAKLTSVETQTESELEVMLKKTTEKLNDCMQICRHRFNYIKDLEEKLKQNENSDTSNISSQTIGQINILKSKLEMQKKEIATLTNKYEYAKKALKLRKDEIDELRKGAGIAVAEVSSK
ncbi:hypothetical protein KR093_006556 [Drosophila rubida]|uniref:Kinesin motor domain-containing protein n=1 Tax=Drosophila rubida TaxID=30044 RepID=A0AAD4K533_9MUSC|nr:hypothetical protein KR093_006556 [Drosophila rubida]